MIVDIPSSLPYSFNTIILIAWRPNTSIRTYPCTLRTPRGDLCYFHTRARRNVMVVRRCVYQLVLLLPYINLSGGNCPTFSYIFTFSARGTSNIDTRMNPVEILTLRLWHWQFFILFGARRGQEREKGGVGRGSKFIAVAMNRDTGM